MNVSRENWFVRNWVAVVGFCVQLIVLGIFIGRQEQILTNQEKRISSLEQRVTSHHEDNSMHTNAEWRASVLSKLDRMDGKIDAHLLETRNQK